ncbi:tetratricopeptide repeat protein [Streptomyces sp. NPDC047841]|uniref:tetratricopeptide repeat protein n=1 Tax=Streptomyces sp. NPDC047841 TaxID=3154708 RepID=UPI003455F660
MLHTLHRVRLTVVAPRDDQRRASATSATPSSSLSRGTRPPRRRHRETHPDTLQCRNNLAFAYASAGDPSRAVPLFESTLTQCERALGQTRPDTLQSRDNLAHARRAARAVQRRGAPATAAAPLPQRPPRASE